MKTKIAVMGAGSWGTALAILLANNNLDVTLWGKNAAEIVNMQQQRCNSKYLPQSIFPDNLHVTSNLAQAVQDASDILIVIPSHAYSEFLANLKPLITKNIDIASSSKGFCDGKCLHQVINEQLGERNIAIISGPSFAKEVAANLPTAVVVASNNDDYAQTWLQYLNNKNFRPYKSNDVMGVEIAGSVKNVLAIATGIASGLQMGSNAQAAIITRGLAEITRLGIAMGAQTETFMGLAGLGDVVLTCTDPQSRNRSFGVAIGSGKTVPQAKIEILQVIEGIHTTQEVHALAKSYHVDMPITEQVYQVLFEGVPAKVAAEKLLARDLKAE